MTARESGPDAVRRLGAGARWEGADPAERAAAIEAAFDFRGDVTLRLRSGGPVTGYLANRDPRAAEPFVQLFPADGSAPRDIRYADIVAVDFSERDPASGQSWESWVKRYRARKEGREDPAGATLPESGHD